MWRKLGGDKPVQDDNPQQFPVSTILCRRSLETWPIHPSTKLQSRTYKQNRDNMRSHHYLSDACLQPALHDFSHATNESNNKMSTGTPSLNGLTSPAMVSVSDPFVPLTC
jgi:hypothetical protein